MWRFRPLLYERSRLPTSAANLVATDAARGENACERAEWVTKFAGLKI